MDVTVAQVLGECGAVGLGPVDVLPDERAVDKNAELVEQVDEFVGQR